MVKNQMHGVYSWLRRDFIDSDDREPYEEEILIFVCANLDLIRIRMNKYLEAKDKWEGNDKVTQLIFQPNEMQTNTWFRSAGWCNTKGGFLIKGVPTLNSFFSTV